MGKTTGSRKWLRPKESLYSSGLGWLILAVVFLVVLNLLVFIQSASFEFVDWDDPVYVINNPLIKDLTPAGIWRIFSSFVSGNYHPLTMLTYASQYAWRGLDPYVFHTTNLFLHIFYVLA